MSREIVEPGVVVPLFAKGPSRRAEDHDLEERQRLDLMGEGCAILYMMEMEELAGWISAMRSRLQK